MNNEGSYKERVDEMLNSLKAASNRAQISKEAYRRYKGVVLDSTETLISAANLYSVKSMERVRVDNDDKLTEQQIESRHAEIDAAFDVADANIEKSIDNLNKIADFLVSHNLSHWPQEFTMAKTSGEMFKVASETSIEYAFFAHLAREKVRESRGLSSRPPQGVTQEEEARIVNAGESAKENLSTAIEASAIDQERLPHIINLLNRKIYTLKEDNLERKFNREEAKDIIGKFDVIKADGSVARVSAKMYLFPKEGKLYMSEESFKRDVHAIGIPMVENGVLGGQVNLSAEDRSWYETLPPESRIHQFGYAITNPNREQREGILQYLMLFCQIKKEEIIQLLSFAKNSARGNSPRAQYAGRYASDLAYVESLDVSTSAKIEYSKNMLQRKTPPDMAKDGKEVGKETR